MTFRPAFEPAVERGQGGPARLRLPLGRILQVGQRDRLLVAMFPSVNGYFFTRTYSSAIAAINFDRSGTTRIVGSC